uniref:U6 snRNA biogenesis 1 n=1 Tax=Mus musculus TaxID=10090 RepID=A0A1D5RM87_MOUSE
MSSAPLVGYSSSGSEDEAEAVAAGRSKPVARTPFPVRSFQCLTVC